MSKIKNNYSGFTLIEVLVSLLLSAMVAFFVYTMMLSSYSAYNRFSSTSKNAGSIRYFLTLFSNSIKYTTSKPQITTGAMIFKCYDKASNKNVEERYYFDGGGDFVESDKYSLNVSSSAAYPEKELGVLKRQIKSGTTVLEDSVVSNIVRRIYYYIPAKKATEDYGHMNFCIIYDDVVDGKVDSATGKMQAKSNNMTEMNTTNTITRAAYRYFFRGYN